MKIIVKPKIEPQDIVYHVDDNDQNYNALLRHAGYTYPSIKFRNTVIHFIDIVNFNISIGKNFLPILTTTFNDSTHSISDNDFPIQDDICTIFLGNTKDIANKPVHADFSITQCSKSNDRISITAELYIPNWRSSGIKSYGNLSRFDTIKAFCSEHGLGLISNINSSDDVSLHNQYGISNSAYLDELVSNIYKENSRFWSFIDGNYNLNIIDLVRMVDAPQVTETINYNIQSGEALETPQDIVITNNTDIDSQFRFVDYSIINRMGSMKRTAPTAIQHNIINKNYLTNSFDEETFDNIISDTSNGDIIDLYSSFEDATFLKSHTDSVDNEHNYMDSVANDINEMGKRQFLHGMRVRIPLNTASYLLYIGKKVPIKIINTLKGHSPTNHINDTNNAHSIPPSSLRGEVVENKTLSGWFSIVGINWNYRNSDQEMRMTIDCTKRHWHKQYLTINNNG